MEPIRTDPVLAPVAGLVLLHLYLGATSLAGLAWSRLSVTVPLSLLAGLVAGRRWWKWRSVRRHGGADGRPPRGGSTFRSFAGEAGWGDLVAGLSILVLGTLALLRRIAASDFIYHWGIKGERFTLTGGVDFAFLAAPWNGYLHPDYPNLVPELFAATALSEGRFRESTVLLWSVVATGLVLLAARRLARCTIPDPTDAQLTVAALALAVTSFCISWQMMGNADTWMALAVLLAAASFVGEPDGDLSVGCAAALAAAVKIEGVVFAALVAVLHLGRSVARRRLRAGVLLRSVLPPALTVAAWAVPVAAHGLGQAYTTFDIGPGRPLAMLPILLSSLLNDGWHGLSLVAVGLVLTLPLFRRFRLASILLFGQLAFYLAAYVTTSRDMELLIRTTAPRLVFHLLPAAFVLGAALLLAGGSQSDERTRSGKKRG